MTPLQPIISKIDTLYGTKYVKRILKLMEDFHFNIEDIVDRPSFSSKKQFCEYGFKYEYVEQHTGYECDDYYGTMFYPLPDGKFISVTYRC